MVEEINTLDPTQGIASEIFVINQIVETLFITGKDEEAEPNLLSEFEQSADLREWTLHLLPGVKFSNGQPMTSADVVFSLEAVQKSEIWGNLYESISEIKAEGPDTVVIKSKVPAPALADTLTLFASGIVPKNYGGASQEEFAKNPIGTGAFELASWDPGNQVTLKRNPNYRVDGRPYLDELIFVPVSDGNARVAQLKGGQLNVVGEPPWSQISPLENTPGLTIAKAEETVTNSLLLNDKNPLFKDPRAREAVDLAINRDDITNASTSGQAKPTVSWFPGFVRYAKDIEPPAQDIEKAKQLLDEAVKETGVQPTIEMTYQAGESIYADGSQVVQQDLEAVGFDITLKPLEAAAFQELVFGGDYDLSMIKVITLMYDPVEFAAFYPATGGLFTFSNTDKVNELVVAAAEEVDPDKRRDLYYEIQELIADENYVITVSDLPNVYALQDDITGFSVPGTGYIKYSEVAFAE